MDRERIIVVFFFGFLALITYELYVVFDPFLMPIAWAILLAFLVHPALIALNKHIKQRTTCALIITLAVALGVILPATWLSARLVHEAQTLYTGISNISTSGELSEASQWIRSTAAGARVDAALGRHGVKLEDEIRTLLMQAAKATSDYAVAHSGAVASNVASVIFHFAIALLTFFYLLRDGEFYYEALRELTPLHEEDKAAIFETLRVTLSSVMRGLLLTALMDGVALGLGYLVLNVPYWALLALLTAAGGLLPMGGTAVVWVPVTIYLGVEVGWGAAIAMLVWAAITLAIIDNVIKPLAMRHGTGLPTLALFFGLAGGIDVYGPLGLFAGPAVIAVFAALLRAYRRTYVLESAPQAGSAAPTPLASPPTPLASPPTHRRVKKGP
jgi:predicted PurR-regulated permease PerM